MPVTHRFQNVAFFRRLWCVLYIIHVSLFCLCFQSLEKAQNIVVRYDFQGNPTGSQDLYLFLGGMLMIPLITIGVLLFVLRYFPQAITLPHRSYWLAPDQKVETLKRLNLLINQLICVWLAGFMMLSLFLVFENTSASDASLIGINLHLLTLCAIIIVGSLFIPLAVVTALQFNQFRKPPKVDA